MPDVSVIVRGSQYAGYWSLREQFGLSMLSQEQVTLRQLPRRPSSWQSRNGRVDDKESTWRVCHEARFGVNIAGQVIYALHLTLHLRLLAAARICTSSRWSRETRSTPEADRR